ncbi:hypothetical protein [Thermoflavimicrobium dichotomicum]|nr:hypothetical protein [Thermoflavimicrobium dichotomicum]
MGTCLWVERVFRSIGVIEYSKTDWNTWDAANLFLGKDAVNPAVLRDFK